MRGKHASAGRGMAAPGITPADAGKTRYGQFASKTIWDHPRGCGENTKREALEFCMQGSPPRMRGKLEGIDRKILTAGITPADAGKTLGFSFPFDVYKDHPRGCGENAVAKQQRKI